MSYDNDQTYKNLASQALEQYEPVLRDLPELRRLPVVEPTPWGDPQLVLKVGPKVSYRRLQEIRDLVSGEPVVPVVFVKLDREQ